MKKEKLTRDEILTRMSNAYCELLTAIAPVIRNNGDVENGIREGLNKFLSNVCIALKGKRETDFYSEKACEKLKNHDKSGFVYEHVVPKKIYQDEIVDSFVNGNGMSVEEIRAKLDRYWLIATITKDEDSLLSRQSMPSGWNGEDVLARYHQAKIPLMTQEEFLKQCN